jgi:hypothetical protein
MVTITVSALASLLLLSLGIWLLIRAGGKPPPDIRTESHRSQAEYDFNRRAALLRQQSYACLMAAALCFLVCLAITGLTTLSAE